MVDDRDFLVRFRGVRGSIATPGAGTARYGGNTACVEVRCGDRLLILDAGTGIRGFGAEIRRAAVPSGPPFVADLLLSHTHLDHVCGLPFFQPAHDTGGGDGGTGPRARVWAGHLAPERGQGIRDVLNQLTIDPLFPVPIESLGVELACEDFAAGDTLDPGGGISVATAPLNYPGGATGYRIAWAGRSVCYVTDTEHVPGRPDETILALIEGADLFIYDSTCTDGEYPERAGWGHSTWQEGARLAESGGVRTCVAFHHDPGHDDGFMDGVAAALRAARPGSVVAREGLTLCP